MTTSLGEKMRDLAGKLPERSFELRRRADVFDAATQGYFFAEAPTITAKGFLSAWTQARALYTELSEMETA